MTISLTVLLLLIVIAAIRGVIGQAAALVPAKRATPVDPMETPRYE